jgi:diguanylate cyclase (GGDEF)-like protein/PAS domain S-box-containing protein
MRINSLSFKHKLLIVFIVYGLILVSITQFSIYKIHESNFKTFNVDKASYQFIEYEKFLKFYLHSLQLKLKVIEQSNVMSGAFDPQHIDLNTESLFLDISKTADEIMQLRFIDAQGQERIRVDRQKYGAIPYLVVSDKLQNKHNRYYFIEIMKRNQNEFWYSKLDLNIEHDTIEKPINPVLRIGTPMYHDGEKIGILIINIFMKDFLQTFVDSALFNVFIIDKEGAILAHTTHQECWSKYLDKNVSIHTFFPKESEQILNSDEVKTKTLYAKKIFLNNDEGIRIILQPKAPSLRQDHRLIIEFLYVMLGVIAFSIPMAYFLARTPVKLKEEVDEMNTSLEKRVAQKTLELQHLNDHLEHKISERTREQDILLSLFDLSDAVLFKWNNDETWSVNSVSQSVQRLLGYSPDALLSHQIVYAKLIHPDDIERVEQEVHHAIENNSYFFTHQPYRIFTLEGEVKWILDNTVIVRDSENTIINFVGYLTDITALKKSEIKLKHLSQTDQLTQINNRMHLDNILQDQYYRFHRNHEKCSIILIDIDHFKSVNDEFGHIAGDMVLVEFANLLLSHIRQSDYFGRWGGEEFLVILPHTDMEQALLLAEKLRKKVEAFNFSIIEHKTASFGVSTFKKGMSVEELIDAADRALYLSKEQGRNRINSVQ